MKEKYVGRKLEIIYLDKKGRVAQRRIEAVLVRGNSLLAYCLEKRAIKTFSLKRILAAMPLTNEEAG